MNKIKPYTISKRIVYEAYKRVKANGGSCGVDGQTIKDYEVDLKGNLYKLWNRMSSGSYFPPAVLSVAIPKADGKERMLGIPTVEDRIAQMIVKLYLEPEIDHEFSEDSYGYRVNKSALEAIRRTRERCWKRDWIIDIDIRGFFDNLNHELLMKAVKYHTDCPWILLYIERWLKADIRIKAEEIERRNQGTPQGGVISPLLSNLFLHYAFDKWMSIKYPKNPYARYADDIIVHSNSKEEAEAMLVRIKERLYECNLETHPTKTKIVYCKDSNRKGKYENIKFTFLGYTFMPRKVKKGERTFCGFNPGVSNEAKRRMNHTIRREKLHLRSKSTIEEIAQSINPKLRGWINYYGKFYKTALRPVFYHLNETLVRWVKRKYKRFRGKFKRAMYWLGKVYETNPNLFAHWKYVKPTAE